MFFSSFHLSYVLENVQDRVYTSCFLFFSEFALFKKGQNLSSSNKVPKISRIFYVNIPSFSVPETKQIQNDSKHNFFSPKSRSKHWILVNIRSVDFSVLFHSTGLTLIRYFFYVANKRHVIHLAHGCCCDVPIIK